MIYDFDKEIDRSNSASFKWDAVGQRYEGEDLLPMWVADMDFQAPIEVVQALTKRAEYGIYGYTFRTEAYYKAIIDWQEKRHGWQVEKDWITSSPGVVTALSLCVTKFSEPKDKIVLQGPVYHPFYHVIESNGREIVNNPLILNEQYYTMDFDLLETQLKDPKVKMLLLCNPHNPVGRVWKKEELERLGRLCIENDVLVIADEIHGDLILPGNRHVPFASLSDSFAQNCIVCTAPSKTFNMAGMQTSVIIIPNESIREKYNEGLRTLHINMESYFGVTVVESCYQYGDEWLDQLIEYLQGNIDYLTAYIKENMPQVKVFPTEGTYLVWLDFKEITKDRDALKTLIYKYAKVAMNEGASFGTEGVGFMRMNIACPRSTLKKGLERLVHGIEQFSASAEA